MYDLVPPSMKAQFNLINKPNQSIKLSVNIIDKHQKKKGLKNYKYNKINILNIQFKYKKLSIFLLNIYLKILIKIILIKLFWDLLFMIILLKYSISNIVLIQNKKRFRSNSFWIFTKRFYLFNL